MGEKNKQSDNNEQIQLHQENGLNGDILQCSFIDNYQALPIKVSLYSWEELKVEIDYKIKTKSANRYYFNVFRMNYYSV